MENANRRAKAAETSARLCAEAAAASGRSAERSAQAAQASGEAAKATVELVSQAAMGARHRVPACLEITARRELDVGEVSLANLGSTPARELRVASNFLNCDETPADLQLKSRVHNVGLGPGVSCSLAHFLRVSPTDSLAIASGRKLMLGCGQAPYCDVFEVKGSDSTHAESGRRFCISGLAI